MRLKQSFKLVGKANRHRAAPPKGATSKDDALPCPLPPMLKQGRGKTRHAYLLLDKQSEGCAKNSIIIIA